MQGIHSGKRQSLVVARSYDNVDQIIFDPLPSYISVLSELGVAPPFLVMISVVGVSGTVARRAADRREAA
jgi:hypothetical protein